MTKLLVSFATRPSQGSEGGVGWAFASHAALNAVRRREKLILAIDQRDFREVMSAFHTMAEVLKWVEVVPIQVPDALLKKYGNSRTRESYLGWMMRARPVILKLAVSNDVDVVHQVTFATASLPHVLPTKRGIRSVWGPVAVPSAPVSSEHRRPGGLERAGLWGIQRLAKHNAKDVDLMVAQNSFTQECLSPIETVLEPNIFVDIDHLTSTNVEDDLLSMSGLLVNRKRPWLAVGAMLDPRLQDYRLQVLGDGILRPSLESFVRQERLERRVTFLGTRERGDALKSLAASRALLHPSAREGSAWVVGEAAALGIPAVVFEGSGADSTVILSGNGGHVARNSSNDHVRVFADGVVDVLSRPRPVPSRRWSTARVEPLLDLWWRTDAK